MQAVVAKRLFWTFQRVLITWHSKKLFGHWLLFIPWTWHWSMYMARPVGSIGFSSRTLATNEKYIYILINRQTIIHIILPKWKNRIKYIDKQMYSNTHCFAHYQQFLKTFDDLCKQFGSRWDPSRSKLFDTQMVYRYNKVQWNICDRNNKFVTIFERKKNHHVKSWCVVKERKKPIQYILAAVLYIGLDESSSIPPALTRQHLDSDVDKTTKDQALPSRSQWFSKVGRLHWCLIYPESVKLETSLS